MRFILEEENKRLDLISSEKFMLSRSRAQKLIECGKITVNGEVLSSSYKVKQNDVLELLEDLEEEIQTKYHFKILDHSVKFYGYCSKCQEEMEKQEEK